MKKGFTLVEMLVVIAILGILMAMMIPAAGMILKRAKRARAQSDAAVVATVLLKYQAEYNRWPGAYLGAGGGVTDAEWVNLMAPKPGGPALSNNVKRIVFFEPGGGALATDGIYAGAFVDPWGMPFQFQFDKSGKGSLVNPDPAPETGESNPIRARAIAWSAGEDEKYGGADELQWDDNVKSWQ